MEAESWRGRAQNHEVGISGSKCTPSGPFQPDWRHPSQSDTISLSEWVEPGFLPEPQMGNGDPGDQAKEAEGGARLSLSGSLSHLGSALRRLLLHGRDQKPQP